MTIPIIVGLALIYAILEEFKSMNKTNRRGRVRKEATRGRQEHRRKMRAARQKRELTAQVDKSKKNSESA